MKKMSAEQKALIIEALKENPNAGAVARKFGRPIGTIRSMAKREEIDLVAGKKKVGQLPAEIYARIFAELKLYPNAKAVAQKIGCNQETVGRLAKRARIELTAGRGRPRKQSVQSAYTQHAIRKLFL